MPTIEFFTVLGAAGVALWVIWLIVTGRLHADSEVVNLKLEIVGLQKDKGDMLVENKQMRETFAEVAPLLRDILRILETEQDEEAP